MDREEFKQRFLQAQMNPIYFYIYLRKNENYVKPLILTETDKYLSSMEDLQDCIIVDVSDLTETDKYNNIDKGTYLAEDYDVLGFNTIIVDYDYTDDADIIIRFFDKVNKEILYTTCIISSGSSDNIIYTRPSKYAIYSGTCRKLKNDNYGYYISYTPSNRYIYTLSCVPYGNYDIIPLSYIGTSSGRSFAYKPNQSFDIDYDGETHEYTFYIEPKYEIRCILMSYDTNENIANYEYYHGHKDEDEESESYGEYIWDFLGIVNYRDNPYSKYLSVNNYDSSKYISEGSTIEFDDIISLYEQTVQIDPDNYYINQMYRGEENRPI